MGKGALVTGGSRGIGRGIALELASEGYDIFFTYSTALGEAEETARQIEALGVKVSFMQASLQQRGVAEEVVRAAVRALGQIHVLCNNAGITRFSNVLALPDEQLDELMALDFRAYVVCLRETARHMVKHGIKGSIVNITSVRANRAFPGDGIYGGMKSALFRAAESFALDLAPYGIRVNTVAPGAIQVRFDERTDAAYASLAPRIPLGRQGWCSDIGKAVAFLADNEKSGYITGSLVKVDGGLTLPGMPEFPKDRQEAIGWGAFTPDKTWDDSQL